MKYYKPTFISMIIFILVFISCLLIIFLHDEKEKIVMYEQEIIGLEAKVSEYEAIPSPTNTPTPTSSPTPTNTPTPSPTPIVEISNQQFYDECVVRGLVTPAHDYDDRITKECGGYMGESGRETYYNLRMDNCVAYMRELGFDEIEYPYWIRDDGAKMLGLYVMCAANWKIRPRGTILPTSLGDAIVVDTGEFVKDYPNGVDLAVDW